VRHASDVADAVYLNIHSTEDPHGGVPAKPDTFDKDIGFGETELLFGGSSCPFGRHLGGIGSALLGTAKAASAGTGVSQDVTLGVGKGDDGVIKGCQDVHLAVRYRTLGLFALGSGFLGCFGVSVSRSSGCRRGLDFFGSGGCGVFWHGLSLGGYFLGGATDGHFAAAAGAGIGLGTLAA
jgi:hypothetical protein